MLSTLAFSLYGEAKNVIVVKKDPCTNSPKYPRSPTCPIIGEQEDFNFTFSPNLAGCQIDIISKGEIIFSTHIDENGSVELPESLEGEFELHLYVGENVFSGLIVL